MNIQLSQRDRVRFEGKFVRSPGCWKWTDKPVKDGYAQFGIRGKSFRANRIAYYLSNGKIPKNSLVLHKCDNRLCVNPAHLFLGSQKDNVHDCMKKGRFTVGSKNGISKLTEEQVREIRFLYGRYGKGGLVQSELAKRYGVSRVLVSDITRGKTWKHCEDDTWQKS